MQKSIHDFLDIPEHFVEFRLSKLLDLQDKHGLVIGVDFDNTLFQHHLNEANIELIRLLKQAQAFGMKLCVWTANKDLKMVSAFWAEHDLEYDYFNESPVMFNDTKPHFNILLDDTAGLPYAIAELKYILDYLMDKKLDKLAKGSVKPEVKERLTKRFEGRLDIITERMKDYFNCSKVV